MDRIAGLIPAAGAGRRMRGGDKLLEQVEGLPLLARAARALAAGGCAPVRVTLPPGAAARTAALHGTGAEALEVADHAEGMAASLRAGAAAAGAAAGLLILPGDMPEIGPGDIAAMLAAQRNHPDRILRATAQDGTPGHPVLIPRRLFPALLALHGDTGARALVAAEGAAVVPVPLPGRRALTDLDTPEAWADWRAGRV